jgi:integrase
MAEVRRRRTKGGETRYDVRVRIGGRVVTRTFERRKDADNYGRLIEADRVRGLAVDPRAGAERLDDYAARWLDQRRVKGRPLAPRTQELYRDLLDHHVLPELGRIELGDLTTEMVRGWHAAAGRRTTPTVAAKAYRLLHAILATAEQDGRVGRNPCRIKGAGAESAPERPTVSPELVLDLADAIEERYRAMVLLAGFGALRLGELLALRVAHVDPLHGTVTVTEASVHLRSGRSLTGEPKSDAGRRTVHLPGVVVEALSHHVATFGPGPGGLVFSGPKGGSLRRGTFYAAWARAKGQVDAPAGLRPHDLRHAGATLAAWTGACTKELMSRLGHSSSRAALIYQHAATNRDQAIAAGLDAVVAGISRSPKGAVSQLPAPGPRDGRAMGGS